MSSDVRKVDACPQCIERVLCTPHAVALQTNLTGLRCDYRCWKCGYEWFTGWRIPEVLADVPPLRRASVLANLLDPVEAMRHWGEDVRRLIAELGRGRAA